MFSTRKMPHSSGISQFLAYQYRKHGDDATKARLPVSPMKHLRRVTNCTIKTLRMAPTNAPAKITSSPEFGIYMILQVIGNERVTRYIGQYSQRNADNGRCTRRQSVYTIRNIGPV
jgi:hypothetical protein